MKTTREHLARIRAFSRSWYGDGRAVLLLAFISACFITFYTTELTLLQSVFLKKHLPMLLFSFVLMVFAVYSIAACVYYLDHHPYFRQQEVSRWITQFFVLGFGLSLIALWVVYETYQFAFGIDLRQTDYLERDFVVVICCLIMVQVYFEVRKLRKDKEEANQKISELQAQLQRCDGQMSELHNQVASCEGQYQDLLSQSRALYKKEKRWQRIFAEVTQMVEMKIENHSMCLPMTQIAYFYIDKRYSGTKILHAQLLDGRKAQVKGDALAHYHKQFYWSTYRVSRYLLLSQMAVSSMEERKEKHLIGFLGDNIPPVEIHDSAFQRIKKRRNLFLEIMFGVN